MARVEGSVWRREGAIRSGALTGLAAIVLAGAAAGAGALLARKFGRDAETDGFLAAYSVYLVLTIAAQSVRMVVVPDLTRADQEGRLGGEARAYAVSFLAFAVPVVVLVAVFSRPLGDLITGSLPPSAARIAARALVVLVPAAFGQMLAALAASVLAARNSFGAAALGFAVGGLVGLAVFAAFAGGHGLVALAWGLAANAAVAIVVPGVVIARHRLLAGERAARLAVLARLRQFAEGAAVPLALQGCYLVGLRLAAKLGIGQVTSFTYAYLFAGTLVSATAFSLGLVSSASLTRRGLDPESAARHVVHAAWVALVLVGAAAGVFALVGGRVVGLVLGSAYGGGVGASLGRLVVWFGPWMLAWSGFAVTFPLVFVAGRRRLLVPIGLAGFLLSIPLALGLRAAFGLDGIALATGLATVAVVGGLMWAVSPLTFRIGAVGLVRLGVVVGAVTALAFGVADLVVPPIPAAAAGVVLYLALLRALRSIGLGEAWAYVRGLG